MNPLVIADHLVEQTLTTAGVPQPCRREPLRVWALSGVERVHRPDDRGSVILKYARGPFAKEGEVLAHVARHGVPVPSVEAVVRADDELVLVLEDLGEPIREPSIHDATTAAVAVHQAMPPPGIPILDAAGLAELPDTCAARIAELADADRWPGQGTGTDIATLHALAAAAKTRIEGTSLAPFGLCHGEFNPTSLHIGAHGWRLLDWAGATLGLGLLDLAGWQWTTDTPDIEAFDALVDAYIDAGGPETTRSNRGGLIAGQWAFGWHRLVVISWYLEQQTTWIADPSLDDTYQDVIRRHLSEATECLQP